MEELANRVAVVTGGAKGIGKATVEKMVEAGAAVAIWDVDETAGEALASELNAKGANCKFYAVDTTNFEVVNQAAQAVKAQFGRIDILVNNAGITRDASMKKMTHEQWDLVIAVNLTGVFNCGKAIAPIMIENGYGRIINAASIVGLYGNFGQSNYVATKAGVIGMTKTWAREFGRKGITCNAIAPGFINTSMMDTIPEKILDDLRAKTPMARLGEPEDIAHAYVFLASEKAGFITGTVLSVDGGLVL